MSPMKIQNSIMCDSKVWEPPAQVRIRTPSLTSFVTLDKTCNLSASNLFSSNTNNRSDRIEPLNGLSKWTTEKHLGELPDYKRTINFVIILTVTNFTCDVLQVPHSLSASVPTLPQPCGGSQE